MELKAEIVFIPYNPVKSIKILYDSTLYANCEFWTADEVLINSLQGRFAWVKWIEARPE